MIKTGWKLLFVAPLTFGLSMPSEAAMTKLSAAYDVKVVEVGYDFIAEASERVPSPSVKGIQLALEEIAMEIPAARKTDAARCYDDRMLQQLDKSGFVSGFYK